MARRRAVGQVHRALVQLGGKTVTGSGGPDGSPEERARLTALMVGLDLEVRPSALLRPSWMADGACVEHSEVEFVPSTERAENAVVAEARAVCAGCLCWRECLDYALGDRTLLGIWAGTTTAERRVLRREAKRAS